MSARVEMQSALKNAPVVEETLAGELEKGRIVGPLSVSTDSCESLRRIPKNHQPGKWRLIVDLSHPKGSSVNDGISPALCTLHYSSVDEAIRQALEHTQLEKFDSYRVVPVHCMDPLLLGMLWKGSCMLIRLCPLA